MLAIAAGGLYLYYMYNKTKSPENYESGQHPAERGPIGARKFTGTAPERAFTRIPNNQRREQPPEVRRRLPNPDYHEHPDLTKARLNRLYEAMPDGPIGWSRGKLGKDKHLIANRVPHHHPGLSKAGIVARSPNTF